MTRSIQLPLTKELAGSLHMGDQVLLSGVRGSDNCGPHGQMGSSDDLSGRARHDRKGETFEGSKRSDHGILRRVLRRDRRRGGAFVKAYSQK